MILFNASSCRELDVYKHIKIYHFRNKCLCRVIVSVPYIIVLLRYTLMYLVSMCSRSCGMLTNACLVLLALLPLVARSNEIKPCPGDTRGDRRCNHDPTHRVCAKIGVTGTSFWEFTGQRSWCGSVSNYGDQNDGKLRCPPENPTWCICKWATAKWIKGEGCNERIQFDCEATDVCNLKASYFDGDVDLKPAHDCMMQKCKEQWDACPDSESQARSFHTRDFLEARNLQF